MSGTKQDAERGNTLCWLDGECFSYETATLLDDGSYQFDGCVRGQYNTTATAHNAGASFARLDQTLLKQAYLKEDIGKTLYFKFCSYNSLSGLSPSSLNLSIAKIKVLFKYAKNVYNLIKIDPSENLHYAKERRKKAVKALSQDELNTLMTSMQDERMDSIRDVCNRRICRAPFWRDSRPNRCRY